MLLTKALSSVDAYVDFFSDQTLPMLRKSQKALEQLRSNADEINSKILAGIVEEDPLLALYLFRCQSRFPRKTLGHEVTTVDRIILMMGTRHFYEACMACPVLENQLEEQRHALLGALQVINVSRKAARCAKEWAILRNDMNVEEITVAALLHGVVEIMCWIFASQLAMQVKKKQEDNPQMPVKQAQAEIFGCTAREVLLPLIKRWRMPEVLISLLQENQNPRVVNIKLACRFARHLTKGWDNPALMTDLEMIANLTHQNREQLVARLGVPEHLREQFVLSGHSSEPDLF